MNFTAQDKQVMIDLFSMLLANFPAWRSYMKTKSEADAIMRVWMEAIYDAGINDPEVLKKGVGRAALTLNPTFMPSPQQFVRCCKPELLENRLPDETTAISRAIQVGSSSKNWSQYHPIVYELWKRIDDKHAAKTMTLADALRVYRPVYDALVQDVRTGAIELKKANDERLPQKIEEPKRDADYGTQALDAIKELLEMQPGKVYSTAHKTPQAAWHQRLDSKERAQIMAKIQRNEAYRKKKYGLEIADLSRFESYFDKQEKTA